MFMLYIALPHSPLNKATRNNPPVINSDGVPALLCRCSLAPPALSYRLCLRCHRGPRLASPPCTLSLQAPWCWCLGIPYPPVLRLRVMALSLIPLDSSFLAHPLQGTQQQTPRFERHPIPAADDKPTDRP